MSAVIVPTLGVGMPHLTLCVITMNAERSNRRSHAEHGNDHWLEHYFCGGKSLAIISPKGPVRLVRPPPARLRYGSGSSGNTSSAKR